MPSKNSHSLLVEVLQALGARASTFDQVVAASPRRAVELRSAFEALEAEGLIAATARDRGRVYAVTATGLDALRVRGVRIAVAEAPLMIAFTDIVGSTELLDSLGEGEAHGVRRRHFALLRKLLSRHGGDEVKSLGDGLMLAFGDADRALACARAMQRAVARDGDGLSLRIGIDSGVPVAEGGDYFGLPVVVARRLCDSAGGGEIIASARLGEALATSERDALLLPPTPLRLKGLKEPVLACRVAC